MSYIDKHRIQWIIQIQVQINIEVEFYFSVNLIKNTSFVNVELRNNYIATRLITVYNKR